MKIDELDEWQGLTAEHISNWLHAHGWQQTKPRWWEKGEDGFLFDPQTFDQVWFWLYALAAVHGTNIQGMLREINPRMRKGWPSGDVLAMHDRWVVRKPDGAVIVCRWRPPYMVNAAGGGDFALREQCEEWSFWPCDEHGNKVRWPTDAEGKML